jgi:hypothetical protein
MDQMTINRTSSRARTPQQECHGKECASGARNNYYLGKHLTPDSYLIEQRYSIDRRRLINRAVHGWGVVYGFELSSEDPGGHSGELLIGEGLALDRLGRELIQTHSTWVSLDNLVMLDDKNRVVRQDGRLNDRFDDDKCGDDCWLLSAHYAEKSLDRRKISDPCRCDRIEWDRVCETVVYSLRRIDCDACCDPWECELRCCCPPESPCCSHHRDELATIDREIGTITDTYDERIAELDRQDARRAAEEQRAMEERLARLAAERNRIAGERHARGGCACLCEHLTGLNPSAGCAELNDADDCTQADLDDGIALACLKLEKDECGKWTIKAITDACGPRKLVKRNDLLFDLINGCDVTTIVETGWAKWHRRSVPPVPFVEFAKALGWVKDTEDPEYETRDFWVRFSRPVVADTLKPDAFAMAVMSEHSDDFWRTYVRVPIMSVETDRDGQGYATRAKLVVGTNWLRDAVADRDHMFAQGRTRIEIEVRGDLIVDCLGQQVDGNSRGLAAYPSGNGSPGGSYFSAFTVGRRVARERPAQKTKPQTPPAPTQSTPPAQSPTRVR